MTAHFGSCACVRARVCERGRVLTALLHWLCSPIVDRVFPLEEVEAAHAYMESNANAGKIVLRIA